MDVAEVPVLEESGRVGAVDPAEVLAVLDRVLASTAFRRAARSRDFLSYVVTETLAGRGDRISERTVGRRALGQDPGFDGSSSASVRVRAGRVRTALDGYYADEGRDERLRITIPPGRYVAVFEPLPPAARPAEVSPGVAVVALTATGDRLAVAVAGSLSDSLVHGLAAYAHLRVVGPTSADDGVQRTGRALGVSTVLEGHVVERGDDVKVSLRLCGTDAGELLWSDDRVLTTADLAGFAAEGLWTREITARLGDVTGLVVRQEIARSPEGATTDELAARLAFYSYVDRGTSDSITEAIDLLDRVLVTGRRRADLLAMRAALANSAQNQGLADRDAGLEQAAELAREALTLDGGNAHAHLVLGSVARERGAWDLAIEHAATAVELAPYQPSYLVGAGATMSGAGAWERGGALIREAHRLHPGLAGHTHAWLAIGHLVHGDHARALGEASRLPSGGGFVWGPLYRAMALAGLGHLEQAHEEAGVARSIRPDILADPGAYFSGRMRLSDAERDHLVALIDAATAG